MYFLISAYVYSLYYVVFWSQHHSICSECLILKLRDMFGNKTLPCKPLSTDQHTCTSIESQHICSAFPDSCIYVQIFDGYQCSVSYPCIVFLQSCEQTLHPSPFWQAVYENRARASLLGYLITLDSRTLSCHQFFKLSSLTHCIVSLMYWLNSYVCCILLFY